MTYVEISILDELANVSAPATPLKEAVPPVGLLTSLNVIVGDVDVISLSAYEKIDSLWLTYVSPGFPDMPVKVIIPLAFADNPVNFL